MYICIYVYRYVYICIYVNMYIGVYVCMYVCIWVCICVCICMYVYIYIYIGIYNIHILYNTNIWCLARGYAQLTRQKLIGCSNDIISTTYVSESRLKQMMWTHVSSTQGIWMSIPIWSFWNVGCWNCSKTRTWIIPEWNHFGLRPEQILLSEGPHSLGPWEALELLDPGDSHCVSSYYTWLISDLAHFSIWARF